MVSRTTATALYDFVARDDTELSFAAGDQLVILEKNGERESWWRAQLNGKEGWIPANYLDKPRTLVRTASKTSKKIALLQAQCGFPAPAAGGMQDAVGQQTHVTSATTTDTDTSTNSSALSEAQRSSTPTAPDTPLSSEHRAYSPARTAASSSASSTSSGVLSAASSAHSLPQSAALPASPVASRSASSATQPVAVASASALPPSPSKGAAAPAAASWDEESGRAEPAHNEPPSRARANVCSWLLGQCVLF